MDQELTKFEQESTKAPIWLPIVGVAMFLLVLVVAVMCPGEPPAIGDGGTTQQQSE
jgi:hypothetical protein